jgi:transcriptional regulator with XRE-family HTH domain
MPRKAHRSVEPDHLHPHHLRDWRKHRGMSQEQVAELLEVDRSLISKIENYKAQYTQVILYKLAVCYRCTVEQLLFVDPNASDPPRLIYNNLRKATPEQQKQLSKSFRYC